jgi:hypothetical protein
VRALLLGLVALPACGLDLNLGVNDAGVPYDAACIPGTYSGMYQCTVGSGSPLSFSEQGMLSLTLNPAGAHVLALPLDASLVSANSGTTSVTALSGQLECAPGQPAKLVGRDGPVQFASSAFNGVVSGTGALTATYDGDASPPELVDGVLDSPSTLGSTCTWSAILQP